MPTIKRILDGKEYEIELTPAEIASVCEYAEHKAAEASIADALNERLNDLDKEEDAETVQQIYAILDSLDSIVTMAEDYLGMKAYGDCTEKDAINEIIEKYTEV